MTSIVTLKDKIESMNRGQQIEVLRILNTNPQIYINENSNGTFVNLTSLPETLIYSLRKYVTYVEEQQNHLEIAEKEMSRLNKTYFKGNKEIENTKIP